MWLLIGSSQESAPFQRSRLCSCFRSFLLGVALQKSPPKGRGNFLKGEMSNNQEGNSGSYRALSVAGRRKCGRMLRLGNAERRLGWHSRKGESGWSLQRAPSAERTSERSSASRRRSSPRNRDNDPWCGTLHRCSREASASESAVR
jgi:hypothetical protein